MVAVRSRKVPTPAAKRVQGFPVRPQGRVIYRLGQEGTLLVEVQIRGKSKQMQAVRDALTRFSVQLRHAGVSCDFPYGHFKAIRVGKPNKVRK